MTLKELADVLPGYVVLHIHADSKGVRASAGEIKNHKDLCEAIVTKAIPLEAYTMEVVIEPQKTPLYTL